MMIENGGINIDFTSGFPSVTMHYLGVDPGNCAVVEAQQNLRAKKLAAISGIFYPPNPFSYMLRFMTFIPHVHYKDLNAIQKPCLSRVDTHITRWRFSRIHFPLEESSFSSFLFLHYRILQRSIRIPFTQILANPYRSPEDDGLTHWFTTLKFPLSSCPC